VFGVSSGPVACKKTDGLDEFRRQAAMVRTASLADGARVLSASEPYSSGLWIRKRWELESQATWESYQELVQRRVPERFAPTKQPAGQLTFVRQDQAELLLIEIERLAAGPPLRVRVTFSALPN
jgi:hypothetical protein